MIANAQAVKMKNSGVPWIGEVPSHWSVIAVKRVASVFVPQRNKPELNEETGSPWITLDEVGPKFVAQSGKGLLVSKDALREAGSKVLEAGAVITGCVGTFGTASITQAALVINQQLQAYIPRKINAEFLRFCILNSSAYFESVATSTTISYVNREGFADLLIPLPSLEEQKSIAQFLDRKTAAIDALIAKKQRLIELLEEKRSALINQAVTKGLNPDAPMKDSGIPWIGQIPKHWKLIPLKFVTKLSSGSTPSKANLAYWEGGSIPWVTPKDMKRFYIAESIDYITELAVQETSIRIVPPSSILVVVRGMILAHSFPIALTTSSVTINQDIKALTCSKDVIAEFLARQLAALRDGALALVEEAGHGTKALRTDLFEKMPVVIPPIEEQKEICTYANGQTQVFKATISRLEIQIEKLREYRQSIITAAVTGKLDVTQEVSVSIN